MVQLRLLELNDLGGVALLHLNLSLTQVCILFHHLVVLLLKECNLLN